MLARKGDWVLIEQVYLTCDQRQPNIPQDTKETDFCLRVKGFLADEKKLVGDECVILTKTSRKIKGKLIGLFPCYDHSFGDYLIETAYIEAQLRDLLSGGLDE